MATSEPPFVDDGCFHVENLSMFFNVLRPVGLPDLLVIHTEVVVVCVVIV